MILSIRSRLTLWYTAVLCIVLFAFGAGVLWIQQRFSRSLFDSELDAITQTTLSVFREEFDESHRFERAAAETRKSVNVPGRTVAILDGSGKPIAAHWRGFPPSLLPALPAAPEFMTLQAEATTWRVHITKNHADEVPFYIVSAGPTEHLARERRLLARTLLVATPLALLFAAAVCWWAASRALAPVTHMAAEAEEITAHSPAARLTEGTADDELQQLARAFNRLLSRLATALQTQRQFMADASHELRTPISVARTAADVMLSRPTRPEEEYRDALTIVGEQTTRLGRVVDDMLVLARADAGGFSVQRRLVPFDEVVAETVHELHVLAADRGVHLQAQIEANVTGIGDQQLLHQMLVNLIDNAIKHTPAGRGITVTLRARAGATTISVADMGCGIAPADRERVFERFVRLDPAREGGSGAGLGLPIARWIAEVHGGTLVATGNEFGGSTFVASFPPQPSFPYALAWSVAAAASPSHDAGGARRSAPLRS